MTTAWKFSINREAEEYTDAQIDQMLRESISEVEGDVIMRGNDIYMVKLDDAYSFRMRSGHLVGAPEKARI